MSIAATRPLPETLPVRLPSARLPSLAPDADADPPNPEPVRDLPTPAPAWTGVPLPADSARDRLSLPNDVGDMSGVWARL